MLGNAISFVVDSDYCEGIDNYPAIRLGFVMKMPTTCKEVV